MRQWRRSVREEDEERQRLRRRSRRAGPPRRRARRVPRRSSDSIPAPARADASRRRPDARNTRRQRAAEKGWRRPVRHRPALRRRRSARRGSAPTRRRATASAPHARWQGAVARPRRDLAEHGARARLRAPSNRAAARRGRQVGPADAAPLARCQMPLSPSMQQVEAGMDEVGHIGRRDAWSWRRGTARRAPARPAPAVTKLCSSHGPKKALVRTTSAPGMRVQHARSASALLRP